MAATNVPSFAAATAVGRVDSNTYQFDFPEAWAIGTVPNGGFVAAAILRAVREHFRTTLAKQGQLDCMILHLEFPRRTSVGKAQLAIQHVKLGRQTSTVHVALTQEQRTEVVGYVTFTSFAREEGITLPTAWSLAPAPLPVISFAALRDNKDPNYVLHPNKYAFRHAAARYDVFYPRQGPRHPVGRGALDHWLRFNSGELFTDDSLAMVADVALQVTEGYVGDEAALKDSGLTEKGLGRLWYPTLVLNLEMKKSLHPAGEEWLFSRVQAKRIERGRMDLEVLLCDQAFDLVAISHHVCMIVDVSRNVAARSQGEKGKL